MVRKQLMPTQIPPDQRETEMRSTKEPMVAKVQMKIRMVE